MSALAEYKHLPLTFLGLDFGLARMIGSHGFNNPTAIRDRLFYSWNLILHNEKSKYDVQSNLGVPNYRTLFDWNASRNRFVRIETLVTDSPHFLSELQVIDYVANYYNDIPADGIGLTFIVESFNKLEETAYIWPTFFDIASKKVIFTTRMAGRSGGLGIRNHWANAVHKVILGLRTI